jgi:hypothetical protein
LTSDSVRKLSVADVLARLKAQHSSHYLDLYNVMKGVTLAVAGVSFLELTVRHWSAGRLLLWLVAFGGSVLTYYGATAGATLLNQRPGLPDILFPMLLSVAELALIYRPGLGLEDRHPEWIPVDWFALLAGWSVLCGSVIAFVSRGLKAGLDNKAYSDDLVIVIEEYRDRLRIDLLSAFTAGVLALAAFFAWRVALLPAARWDEVTVALVMMVFILGGIDSQRKASAEIDESLRVAQQAEVP